MGSHGGPTSTSTSIWGGGRSGMSRTSWSFGPPTSRACIQRLYAVLLYGNSVTWWLKRVYWTNGRADARHWRTWEWLTDPPGRDSEWWEREEPPKPGETNPRHGPHYEAGDLIVVCIAGSRGCPPDLVRRCPAIYRVIAEPRWDPDGVDEGQPDDDEWGKEGDRWGVMTHVSCIHAVDSQDGPYPEAFGVELRPGSRSPHITLDDTVGQEAKQLLEQIERGIDHPSPSTPRDRQVKVTEVPIEEGDVEDTRSPVRRKPGERTERSAGS